MMKLKGFFAVLAAGVLTLGTVAYAHTPVCLAYDNGDGTITAEGGFSDGSSAAGVEMRVETPSGSVLLTGKMSEESTFTFDKPAVSFVLVFDAGPGHVVTIPGESIKE